MFGGRLVCKRSSRLVPYIFSACRKLQQTCQIGYVHSLAIDLVPGQMICAWSGHGVSGYARCFPSLLYAMPLLSGGSVTKREVFYASSDSMLCGTVSGWLSAIWQQAVSHNYGVTGVKQHTMLQLALLCTAGAVWPNNKP